MASHVVLGLDIGGANLKAATADKRAVSVPFALWKQPDKLPAALAELVAQFPDATDLAVTMTGELCDCYETKRQGVNAILDAVEFAAKGRPVRVWGTDERFMSAQRARDLYLMAAAANWHALATYAGRYVETITALLIDIGSTTTDLIPFIAGRECTFGRTDADRLRSGELVYMGVRRTPISALMGSDVAAEYFASTHDAYLLLEWAAEDPSDNDTADGRGSTIQLAHARLSRMLCGDPELIPIEETRALATRVMDSQIQVLQGAIRRIADNLPPLDAPWLVSFPETVLLSGSGWFLGHEMLVRTKARCKVISLNDLLGPSVSTCAPAYALAVLAQP